MTNAQAITQLRETASEQEALEAIRACIAVLVAMGWEPNAILSQCRARTTFFDMAPAIEAIAFGRPVKDALKEAA